MCIYANPVRWLTAFYGDWSRKTVVDACCGAHSLAGSKHLLVFLQERVMVIPILEFPTTP